MHYIFRRIYLKYNLNKKKLFFIIYFQINKINKSERIIMLPTEYYVESCTLFDDQYLSYHELIENKVDNEQVESKSQLLAGGFSYTFKNDYRFIIWLILLSKTTFILIFPNDSELNVRRINGNQLELIEQSLVYKLSENCKRITFKNSMIIPRVHIHKDFGDIAIPLVQILIATTFKLYRLTFKIQLNVSALFLTISNQLIIFYSSHQRNFQPKAFFTIFPI